MSSHANDALEEARQTVTQLAMFLVRVADQSGGAERDDLINMAAALARLADVKGAAAWEPRPTHSGNHVPT